MGCAVLWVVLCCGLWDVGDLCVQPTLHHDPPPPRSANHFLCDDDECAGCLVAFSTDNELQHHRRLHHSTRMARWDPSRARPISLEFSASRSRRPIHARAGLSDSPELMPVAPRGSVGQRGSRGGRRQTGGGGGRSRVGRVGGAAVAAASQQQAPPPLPPALLLQQQQGDGDEQEGNWRMVDDDVGMIWGDEEEFPAIGGGGGGGSSATRTHNNNTGLVHTSNQGVGSSSGNTGSAHARGPAPPAGPAAASQAGSTSVSSVWPELMSSRVVQPPDASSGHEEHEDGGAGQAGRKFKALKSVTVRCACGRRSRVEVVAEV